MKQENRVKSKIDYVKPQIIDLGPVTPAIGGSCSTGVSYSSTDCDPGQTPKNEQCVGDGSSADVVCGTGFGPGPT